MPSDAEHLERRRRIWHHNSFLGYCAMASSNMQTIYTAETTTDESRELAFKAREVLAQLAASLRTRKDQEPQ